MENLSCVCRLHTFIVHSIRVNAGGATCGQTRPSTDIVVLDSRIGKVIQTSSFCVCNTFPGKDA